MDINNSVSKTYANKVVDSYGEIVKEVDTIIKQTGYKGEFIASKLGITESTYYQKKRNKSFTYQEMKQIVDLMNEEEEDDDDDDAIEDAYLMKVYNERKNEEDIPILDILRKKYNERNSQEDISERP
jgi:predicted transcriptional regulator